MQFQCPLRLKLLAAVRYLANNPVRTTMQFLVAPQIIDGGKATVATLHLAHMILALQMRLLVSLQLELGIESPSTAFEVAL